jgi:hypothetical protein
VESFNRQHGKYWREYWQDLDKAAIGPYGDNASLYEETNRLYEAANFVDPITFGKRTILRVGDHLEKLKIAPPHDAILFEMGGTAAELFGVETQMPLPPNPALYASQNVAAGIGILRDMLLRVQRKVIDPATTTETLYGTFVRSFSAVARRLPSLARDGGIVEGVPTIPLMELLPNVGLVIEEMLQPFLEPNDLGLFWWVAGLLRKRSEAVDRRSRSRQPTAPSEYDGSPAEIIEAYLADTPFEAIFRAGIPFDIPLEDRGEHTAIVAGSGWGKTQLLQSIIADDLEAYEDPPGLVVIDSTGAMVQRIQRLAVFNEHLKDRLVIIDPEQDPVPALNMFDVSNPRLQGYERNVREGIESEVIALFNYVFSSVENPLSARMSTAFAYMVRLLLSIPGANINTLRALLADNPKGGYEQAAFREHIDKLDETAQDFFRTQYYARSSDGLREQIRARVFDIVKVPAFERMFSTVNKVDMFTELNRGAIVLINTSEALLKEGSPTFGRYMIARVMAAAFERASILPENRRQAFLIVDEAAPYFDETFEKLLNRVRQFKLGVVIAFQNLEQASEKLRSTIASSTAVKYAGGTGYTDARWLSREMRVDAEFVLAQKRDATRPPKWTQFACYVRNFTDRAVSLTVPFYTLENMPKMTDEEHAELLERNRERVAATSPQREHFTPEQLDALDTMASLLTPIALEFSLAEAREQLAEAIAKKDWARAGELEHSIIPELERKSGPAEPRPAPASPDVPRPAATSRDEPLDEGTTDWRE